MKNFLKLSVILVSFGFASFTYAADSTLTVTNNAKDIRVEIENDLLCYPLNGFGPGMSRTTRSLDENPINTNQSKTAVWKNCTIAEKDFFGDIGDHSKIYVKLIDEETGVYLVATVHAERAGNTMTVNFANRNFVISTTHTGDYWREGYLVGVYSTQTTIRVDG